MDAAAIERTTQALFVTLTALRLLQMKLQKEGDDALSALKMPS